MAWDLESEVSDLAIGICNLRSGFRSLESERLPEQRLQHKLSWRAQPVLHKHSARDDHCLWSYQFRGGKLCSVEVFFCSKFLRSFCLVVPTASWCQLGLYIPGLHVSSLIYCSTSPCSTAEGASMSSFIGRQFKQAVQHYKARSAVAGAGAGLR